MWPAPKQESGLLVDLYHLDAAYVSWRSGQNASATFDLYTRSAPFGGAYLLAAGLEPALGFIHEFHLSADDLAYLRQIKDYDAGFIDKLRNYRFTGDIRAMPEGTIVFPNEPLMQVTAPFRDALILESGLLRAIGISTLIATKAARLVDAAKGRDIADFGFRRAQDPYLAARSAIIGGCSSTSFVAAARLFDVPTAGTIPHALVQAFPTEADAFVAVAAAFARYSLLLDTYDVHGAIETAIVVAQEEQARSGHTLAAVRLDSGDLLVDSRYVRQQLDRAGLAATHVLVSGDLDEFRIAALLGEGAPIDGFGVGGNLSVGLGSLASGAVGGTSGAVYKLVWYEGEDPAKIKLAGEKSTWPGRKLVYRIGDFREDIMQLEAEPPPRDGIALLTPAMQDGEVASELPSVLAIQERALANLRALPTLYHAPSDALPYPVRRSEGLIALRDRAAAEHAAP